MEELYLCGNNDAITKVLKFIEDNNLFGKSSDNKIFLMDLHPNLNDNYIKEQGIKRGLDDEKDYQDMMKEVKDQEE